MASPDPIVAPGTEAPAAESQSGEVGSMCCELRSHAQVELGPLQCTLVEPTVQVR